MELEIDQWAKFTIGALLAISGLMVTGKVSGVLAVSWGIALAPIIFLVALGLLILIIGFAAFADGMGR